jgi:phytoene desaturase
MNVIIIGAGLGGLSAAIRLTKKGFSVTILEKNETVGGKVNSVESNGYKFDTGASLLTMRHVLEELFEVAERPIEDYLEIVSLEPICRYFWTDETVFDASTDLQKTENEIAKLEPQDAGNFRKFLADARRKYEVSEKTFLAHSLNDYRNFCARNISKICLLFLRCERSTRTLKVILSRQNCSSFSTVSPLTTVRPLFKHPRLLR